MLCEKCKKKTATVFYNENINGKTRSYSLCGECAGKLREAGEVQDITSMIGSFADPFSELNDGLFGGFFGIPATGAPTEKKCAGCGCTYPMIQKSGRVGCPKCYTTFSQELSRTIRSIHGTTSHTGNVPARQRAQQERAEQLKRLRAQMRDAIASENFEQAAILRDQIRQMEAEVDHKEGE